MLPEKWSTAFRYHVVNGIGIVAMTQRTHVPSNILVAGHRTLVSYEGQNATYLGCNETEHIYQECPRRRRGKKVHQLGRKWR
jgi:hypothetical protein